MSYDKTADRFGAAASTRQSPAVEAVKLTAAMVSDTADLATYAKAMRVWNGTATAITILATPLAAASDLAAAAVPITIPAGSTGYEPISVRRVWATGSTGLVAALSGGTAEVLLLIA
jgi:hypothetical protein